MSSPAPTPPFRFPTDFLWGAATAAHQVEGGNRWNDWWAFEADGRLPFASGEACGHFECFEQDFDLAQRLGHNAHRLSLEWSRLEPEDGRFDHGALDHYGEVLDALVSRGLAPIVTLHHFTNPAWFLAGGGWLRRDAAQRFRRFVEHVAPVLGDRVAHWLTVNEPTVYARHAYLFGEWPPQRRNAWWSARRCMLGMAAAHVEAFRALKETDAEASVGFAHSAAHIVPCNPERRADRLACRLRDHLLNDWFLQRIGGARHLDYLGLNYYNRTILRSQGLGAGALLGKVCREPHHERGPASQTGWEMFAPGLAAVLERFANLGVPLLVTENGIATRDEELRTRFVREHLEQLAGCLARGIDVRGYLYWSLMDNYEWALGFEPRYGLAQVEAGSSERRVRPAAELLGAVARRGELRG